MSYITWIKSLAILLFLSLIMLAVAIFGKAKFDRSWDEFKAGREDFMVECQSSGYDWTHCWDKFQRDQSDALVSAALDRASPFTSENSNRFFGAAITSFGVVAIVIILSIFLRAAIRFFRR